MLKRLVGINSIQYKLVKLVAITFFNLLREAINFCIQYSIFLDSAKVVSIDPLDKKNKANEISSFIPGNKLNTVLNIYELVIRKEMVTHKEKHLYQLIEKSAVIIKLIKKDLSNIAYDLLIAKLEARGFTTDALALVFSFLKNRN